MSTDPSIQRTPRTPRRPDGRSGGGTLRPLACELSCLHRADGSSKLSAGSTQILAAVYGPAAPKNTGRERTAEAVVAVVFKHGTKGGGLGSGGASHPGYGATERELERFLGDSLSSCISVDQYPRTVIEIVVHVVKADGSVVGTALNAAVLALMDAGVSMRSVPVATTCLVEGEGGSETSDLRLDPSAEEEMDEGIAAVVLVTDSARKGVIGSLTFGTLMPESFLACVEGASRASKAVVAFMRLAVEQKVTREAQTLWSS